jgi:hypothetical protein
MVAILTGVTWNLNVILIAFPLWPGMLSISSYIYWPLVLLLLRIVVQFICLFVQWIVDALGG